MEFLLGSTFLVIAFVSVVSTLKESIVTTQVSGLLLMVSSALLIGDSITNAEVGDVFSGIAIVFFTLTYLLSRIDKIKQTKFRVIVPLILSLGFLLFNQQIEFEEYIFSIQSPTIIGLVIFGMLLPEFVKLKSVILNKFFNIENDQSELVIQVLFVGAAAFLGTFFASYLGLFLVTVGFAGNVLINNGRNQNALLALLLLSSISSIAAKGEIEIIDLSLGKTIEGVFFGGFSILLIQLISVSKKISLKGVLVVMGLILFIVGGLTLFVTQKADFGGVDSLIGVYVGAALVVSFQLKTTLMVAIVALLIGLGVIVAPLTINQEEKESVKISIENPTSQKVTKKDEELFDLKGLSLDSLQGAYKINPETVQFKFELGPKGGRTKGAFKTLSGNVNFPINKDQSTFKIEIPVSKLSTFNKFRDESLMGEEYFNESNFPVFKFNSKKMSQSNDVYILTGEFSMLGVSKLQKVEIKYLQTKNPKGEITHALIGKGSLDRTEFGMKPDPKEGNVVEFEFKVDLVK